MPSLAPARHLLGGGELWHLFVALRGSLGLFRGTFVAVFPLRGTFVVVWRHFVAVLDSKELNSFWPFPSVLAHFSFDPY